MSWRSIEREKSLEAHNYHMRRMEQEKIKIEKERNIILNNIFVELSILVNNNGKKLVKKDLTKIQENIQKLF